jgi:hypothetical protein
MNEFLENLIDRQTFNAQKLVELYPPKLYHRNKKVVYQIACPMDAVHNGELTFSRWRGMPLPKVLTSSNFKVQKTALAERSGYFDYEVSKKT